MSAAVVLFHPSADVPGTGASYGENRTSAAVRQISMFGRSLSHVRERERLRIECIQDLVHQGHMSSCPGTGTDTSIERADA
jgi:hypothetical protein